MYYIYSTKAWKGGSSTMESLGSLFHTITFSHPEPTGKYSCFHFEAKKLRVELTVTVSKWLTKKPVYVYLILVMSALLQIYCLL